MTCLTRDPVVAAVPSTRLNSKHCLSISDPDDAARKQQLYATAKNLLLRHGFSRESVLGKEGAGEAGGAAGGAVTPKPKPGRRTALSQAQRDLIKGGAMISRARSGHPS